MNDARPPIDPREPHADDAGFGDLAARIRAAGRYVRVSDDLRPRTVEAARTARTVGRGAWGAALAAAAAAWLFAAAVERSERHRQAAPENVAAADVWQLGETVRRQTTCALGGPTWALVDLFVDMRGRQAELLAEPRAAQ